MHGHSWLDFERELTRLLKIFINSLVNLLEAKSG